MKPSVRGRLNYIIAPLQKLNENNIYMYKKKKGKKKKEGKTSDKCFLELSYEFFMLTVGKKYPKQRRIAKKVLPESVTKAEKNRRSLDLIVCQNFVKFLRTQEISEIFNFQTNRVKHY